MEKVRKTGPTKEKYPHGTINFFKDNLYVNLTQLPG